MKRIVLSAVLCIAACSARAQVAPPSLRYQQSANVRARANGDGGDRFFDHFLHMTGSATVGAGVGTGILWAASELVKRSNDDEDNENSDIFAGDDDSNDGEIAVIGVAVVVLLSPWIGASMGALYASNINRHRQRKLWDDTFMASIFFGGVGTIVGTALGGGFDAPRTVLKVAGFIAGTGVGAAVGTLFAVSQRASFLHFQHGRWSVGALGATQGGISLMQVDL